jgi:NADH dehydrogenase [ubiquinone] 1 alpha subcomplex assembly factor 7
VGVAPEAGGAHGCRVTPLAEKLIAQIRANGPITVADYMAVCLGDRQHGYYLTRDPIGRGGDFVTAPEVSQMFGELIGAWTVLTWEAMGAPSPLTLAELGPGRGTLMADLLRAARARPAFGEAVRVHLIETSPPLRAAQEATLATCGANVTWQERVDALPRGPLIVIANEFFDALPIRQFVGTAEGWAERMVGADGEGRLIFGLRPAAGVGDHPPHLEIPEGRPPDTAGTVVETSPAAIATMQTLAERITRDGGAGLFIDYGYEGPASGDTLQAVRRHRYDDPLAAPGEADLTAHVDFAALAKAAAEAGAVPRHMMAQGAFLLRLGIMERAARLGAGKDAATQAAVEAAVERLCAPKAMGELFKVLAIGEPGLALPGFDDDVP